MAGKHPDIEALSKRIQQAFEEELTRHTQEKVWVTHYGANHIHPKHLVYWIVVASDREKTRLASDAGLMARLRAILDEFEYPIEGRAGVHIGFESEETVKRESGGNFWYHWK